MKTYSGTFDDLGTKNGTLDEAFPKGLIRPDHDRQLNDQLKPHILKNRLLSHGFDFPKKLRLWGSGATLRPQPGKMWESSDWKKGKM